MPSGAQKHTYPAQPNFTGPRKILCQCCKKRDEFNFNAFIRMLGIKLKGSVAIEFQMCFDANGFHSNFIDSILFRFFCSNLCSCTFLFHFSQLRWKWDPSTSAACYRILWNLNIWSWWPHSDIYNAISSKILIGSLLLLYWQHLDS